ncbi:MAG: biopolymer transporter ExbD [Pseudomonadota bacterium]
MRGRRLRPVEEAKVDLTPMLDVVFILLIFFIVTAVFIQEQAIQLEPPPPQSNTPSDPVPVILIRVDESNLIFINERLSDIGAVRGRIEGLRAETPNSAVIIQAHPEAKNGTIVRIRDQAALAEIDKVNVILSDV